MAAWQGKVSASSLWASVPVGGTRGVHGSEYPHCLGEGHLGWRRERTDGNCRQEDGLCLEADNNCGHRIHSPFLSLGAGKDYSPWQIDLLGLYMG